MKLIEIANDIEYRIFVDLDGVMSNFEEGIQKALDHTFGPGITHSEERYEAEPKYRNTMWKALDAYQKAGHEIWYSLNLLPDAMQLWNYVKKYDPQVLTAAGHPKHNGRDQKHRWVAEKLGNDVGVIVTNSAAEKAQYAGQNHILIDDKEKSINPWEAAGGIGILHTSAADTIGKLKDLGI